MIRAWPWLVVLLLAVALGYRLAATTLTSSPQSLRLTIGDHLDEPLRRGGCGLWLHESGLALSPAVSQLLDHALAAPVWRTLDATDGAAFAAIPARIEVDGVVLGLGPAVAGARHLRRDQQLLVVEDRFAALIELAPDAWQGLATECPDD